MASAKKGAQRRALKDWLDVNTSVRTAVEGIVDHGASLTVDRARAILNGMYELQQQTEKLRAFLRDNA